MLQLSGRMLMCEQRVVELRRLIVDSSQLCRVGSCMVEQTRCTRRSTNRPPHLQPKYHAKIEQGLTRENQEYLISDAVAQMARAQVVSPLKDTPSPRGVWVDGSKRTGLLVRKIGVIPQWLNDGTRILTTLLQVLDNHVISYDSPEDWYRKCWSGKKKAFNKFGTFGRIIVGAGPAHPDKYTAVYRGLFNRAGVPPKEHLAGFMVSENAQIQPGTRLYASHFKLGQFVTLTGKTIDWGFQGPMHRWGMKGQGDHTILGGDTTKSHRRVGAIGTTGKRGVWPGKRLAGHMGWEWRHGHGLQILRINYKYQVIYVRGPGVIGDNGEILQMKDYFSDTTKRVQDPPFPTDYPEEAAEPLPFEAFVPGLHQMSMPTIEFQEEEKVVAKKKKTGKKKK